MCGMGVTAALLSTAFLVLPASGAQAVELMRCEVESNLTYTPGLRFESEPQTLVADADYLNCTANPYHVTSGNRINTVSFDRGCITLDHSLSGTLDIVWNTGDTSTIDYEITSDTVLGQTVFTQNGTIVAGLFQGATFFEQVTETAINQLPGCLPPPFGSGSVTNVTGTGTLVLSSAV